MMFDNPWARTDDEFMTPLIFSALLVLFLFHFFHFICENSLGMLPLLFSSLRTLERRFGSKIGYSEDILMGTQFFASVFYRNFNPKTRS